MSVETAPAPYSHDETMAQSYEGKHRGSDETEQNSEYNGKHREQSEQVDGREISPFASTLRRLASVLEARADSRGEHVLNKAHAQALRMNDRRDRYMQDEAFASYADNMPDTLKDSQDEAYDSYRENISATAKRERAERREVFASKAKETASKIGRNTLDIALGAGIVVSEAVRTGAENTRNKFASGIDKSFDTAGKAGDKMLGGIEKGLDRIDQAKQNRQERREARAEAREYKRQDRLKKRQAAEDRKAARHRRWINRQQAVGNTVSANFEKGKDKVISIKTRGHISRAAMTAAREAYRETKQVHKEQSLVDTRK